MGVIKYAYKITRVVGFCINISCHRPGGLSFAAGSLPSLLIDRAVPCLTNLLLPQMSRHTFFYCSFLALGKKKL